MPYLVLVIGHMEYLIDAALHALGLINAESYAAKYLDLIIVNFEEPDAALYALCRAAVKSTVRTT